MNRAPHRIVIVGGGLAGVSTAAALRSEGFTGTVTLVDAGEFPYDRPPLSKDYLLGRTDHKAIALQPAEWYATNDINLISQSTVSEIDTAGRRVVLDSGVAIEADRVVMATGGRAARPPLPGSDGSRVHVLRDVDDADRLRTALTPGARALVVGAGLIGAEVASTAVDLGAEVTLLDPVSPPLASTLGAELARWVHERSAHRGVRVLTTSLESLTTTDTGILALIAGQQTPFEFDAVVLGVGMIPAIELAAAAGLAVDRGIIVDDRQVTSNSAILAVGDPTRIQQGTILLPRAEHWDAASRSGQRAAATILGISAPAPSPPWFWTDRHGLHIEAIGSFADADIIVGRGELGEPGYAAFALTNGTIVGAASVDDANAVRAARRMIARGITVGPERLADTTVDIRQLVRG